MEWLRRRFGRFHQEKKKAKRNYTALAETDKKQDSKEPRRTKDEEFKTIKDQLKAVCEKLQTVQDSGNNILLQNKSNSQEQALVTHMGNHSKKGFYTGTPVLCPFSTRMVQALILMTRDALASGSTDLSDREVEHPKHNTPCDKKQQKVTSKTALLKLAAEEAGAELQKPKVAKQVKWDSSTQQSKPPAASSISPPSVSTVPLPVVAKSGHLASKRTPAKDLTSQRKEPPQPMKPQRVARPKTKPLLHTVQKKRMSTHVKSFGYTALNRKYLMEEEQQLRLEALKKKEQQEAERRRKLEEEKKQKQMEMKRKREEQMRRVREAKVKIDNEKSRKIQEMVAQREERYKTMN